MTLIWGTCHQKYDVAKKGDVRMPEMLKLNQFLRSTLFLWRRMLSGQLAKGEYRK
jgi:hypothetical protein